MTREIKNSSGISGRPPLDIRDRAVLNAILLRLRRALRIEGNITGEHAQPISPHTEPPQPNP